MTKKQINHISFIDAINIAKAHGMKINFNTPDADIKTFARKILRNQKKQKSNGKKN